MGKLDGKVYANPDLVPDKPPDGIQIVNKTTYAQRYKAAQGNKSLRGEGAFSIVYPPVSKNGKIGDPKGQPKAVLNRYFTVNPAPPGGFITTATEDDPDSPTGLDFQYNYFNGGDRYGALFSAASTPVFTLDPQSGDPNRPPGATPYWQHVFFKYTQLEGADTPPNPAGYPLPHSEVAILTHNAWNAEQERSRAAITEQGTFIVLYDVDGHGGEEKYDPKADTFPHASATREHWVYDYFYLGANDRIVATEQQGSGNYAYDHARLPYAEFVLAQLKPSNFGQGVSNGADKVKTEVIDPVTDFVRDTVDDLEDAVKKGLNGIFSWKSLLLIFLALGAGVLVFVLVLKTAAGALSPKVTVNAS